MKAFRNSKKRIIITGGNGMVGSQADFGTRLGQKELDILDKTSIEKAIAKYKPDAILHLAAMTDMAGCQENPSLARKINVTGTKNLAAACKKYGIKLVYLSTCTIFDGKKKTAYKETDKTSPLNVYGKTKRQGELETLKMSHNNLVVRTGWLFGGGSKLDKKFIFNFLQKMKKGEAIQATSDRYGSPTYIPDLLKAIENLLQKNARGIYHVVNKGAVSYFEAATKIRRIGKFKSVIIAVSGEKTKIKRGAMEALASSKIKLRPWEKALKQYLDLLKK